VIGERAQYPIIRAAERDHLRTGKADIPRQFYPARPFLPPAPPCRDVTSSQSLLFKRRYRVFGRTSIHRLKGTIYARIFVFRALAANTRAPECAEFRAPHLLPSSLYKDAVLSHPQRDDDSS
jgi:hypothetical protein